MRIVLFIILASLLANSADSLPATPLSPPDGKDMVLIPGGEFIYGSDPASVKSTLRDLRAPWIEHLYSNEHPRAIRLLPPFYIDRFDVTNANYADFVRATKHPPAQFSRNPQLNAPNLPVVGIGWPDAVAYCIWSNKRLPTEEEWEKAARGPDGRTWPWGEARDNGRYNGKMASRYAPSPVGSYPDGNSPYGVADMAGNVWQMTSSVFDETAHVMRGGSFLNSLAEVRTTVRWAPEDEKQGATWLGFRCAKDANP